MQVSRRSPTAHIDELNHSTQAMQPKESFKLMQVSRQSLIAHIDELNHSTQAMQPEQSFQLMQVSRWSLTAHIDELNHSTQAMQPRNQFDSGKSVDGAQQLTLTSPTAHFEDITILPRPRSSKARSAWAEQPTQPQRLSLKSLAAQFMHTIQIIQFMKKSKNTPVRTQTVKKMNIHLEATYVLGPRPKKKKKYT